MFIAYTGTVCDFWLTKNLAIETFSNHYVRSQEFAKGGGGLEAGNNSKRT